VPALWADDSSSSKQPFEADQYSKERQQNIWGFWVLFMGQRADHKSQMHTPWLEDECFGAVKPQIFEKCKHQG